jgi:hypothetical protein
MKQCIYEHNCNNYKYCNKTLLINNMDSHTQKCNNNVLS